MDGFFDLSTLIADVPTLPTFRAAFIAVGATKPSVAPPARLMDLSSRKSPSDGVTKPWAIPAPNPEMVSLPSSPSVMALAFLTALNPLAEALSTIAIALVSNPTS